MILVFAFSGKMFPHHIFNKSSSLNIFSSSLKLISVGLKKGQKYSRVHLSVKQKLELIEMLDPGLSK